MQANINFFSLSSHTHVCILLYIHIFKMAFGKQYFYVKFNQFMSHFSFSFNLLMMTYIYIYISFQAVVCMHKHMHFIIGGECYSYVCSKHIKV